MIYLYVMYSILVKTHIVSFQNLEEYKVSGLLLAAVSPFMSTLLSTSTSFEVGGPKIILFKWK